MASSTAAARLRELAPGPGAGISAAALAECCAGLLGGGGGDAEAARSALDTLCAAGGEALRRHADELTPLVVGRLGDGDAAVREAARRFLVLLMEMKEINARLENIQPDSSRSDVEHNNSMSAETESAVTNQVRKSLKQKISTRDMSLAAGEGDTTKKSVEPIKVFSEKDLIKETGKVMSALHPDNEWSIRITAMQRVEGIVLGGAADYSAFPMLLKQLVTPLITQLLDRRSTVVKQACHLLNFLSKELLRDFEPCAELLIPALLKNVVITVLVIAESADKCIKEMLRNCKVSRILPKIIEFAKNDRSAVLRVRCCEYAILMLEHWVDTPELQRSANLYEDLIKCCIEDATSEVRSGARACYRMFSRIWPERSHQLFSSFEPSRQKMINDDHDAETNQKQLSAIERVSTAMDKVVKVDSRTSFSSGDLQSARVKISLQHDDMASESPAEDSKDGASAIGSSFEDTSTSGKEIILDRDPDKCDSGIGSSPCYLPSDTAFEPTPDILSSEANIVTTFQDKAECRPNVKQITSRQVQASGGPSQLLRLPPSIRLEDSENLLNKTPVKANSDGSSGGKLRTQQVERHRVGTPHKGVVHKEPKNNHAPNFRRPLLSKQMTNWFYGSTRGDLDSKQLILNEMVNSMDVPSSLTGALSVGLDPKSDWMMRVYAFNFLQQSLVEQSPKGIQEVAQNFEKVMRFVSRYLDDPHHKVAHAALSSLAEIMPFFKKPFEHYLDQMLPRVFSRLSDPKESIKQQCLEVLTLAGENYSIDSLLPALLRSLDEQKSPKSRLAVLEFAKSSFAKCTTDPDISSSSSFLKLWLGKLTLLFKDRNSKVKEAAVIGLSSIYSHYDPASMLSFLVSLPMEEQKRLTRAMKQLIPMIGGDLEEFLQQKRHRQKVPFFDRFAATDPHPGSYIGKQNKSQQHDIAYQSNYVRADDVFSSAVQYIPSFPSEVHDRRHAGKIEPEPYGRRAEMIDKRSSTTRLSSGVPGRSYYSVLSEDTVKSQSIPQTYHQDAASLPEMNGRPVPIKNLHQMSSPLLKMLDDPDESTREFALSLLVEILEKQEKALDNCIETLVVKLLLATKDPALKVVNQAHVCLTMVVTRSDPLKCLRAIASQLGSNDEKILTVSINSLSKLVARLSQKDLMTHLSAFLPALLDAFEIRSPYARKAILLCVVEAYVKLGPALLPHLERLDGAQLQLVVTTSHTRRRSIAAGNDK